MSLNLYVTADRVGLANHGAGSVTFHESEALKFFGPTEVWDRAFLDGRRRVNETHPGEPWAYDSIARTYADREYLEKNYHGQLNLVHFYAGTFTGTVEALQDCGSHVTYTAAAHDIQKSKREHELFGIPFDLPHLTDPALWERYVGGYKAADVVICPSTHSKACMESYGCKNVVVIPHGTTMPEGPIAPLPQRFTVGYLGAIGPDKGLRYLIEAWGKLAYPDAVLVIAGRDSTHPFVQQMIRQWGGSASFALTGWVDDVSTFYNQISLYVQPSVTEGFGIEVLEAMAHGRAVVCSLGAGASDCVPMLGGLCSAGSADMIATQIDSFRRGDEWATQDPGIWRREAEKYTWDKVREQYKALWRSLL